MLIDFHVCVPSHLHAFQGICPLLVSRVSSSPSLLLFNSSCCVSLSLQRIKEKDGADGDMLLFWLLDSTLSGAWSSGDSSSIFSMYCSLSLSVLPILLCEVTSPLCLYLSFVSLSSRLFHLSGVSVYSLQKEFPQAGFLELDQVRIEVTLYNMFDL